MFKDVLKLWIALIVLLALINLFGGALFWPLLLEAPDIVVAIVFVVNGTFWCSVLATALVKAGED